MSKDLLRQALVVIALVITIGLNGLANALPINGQTTGDVANRFPTFFTPAGYVFSIWGLIYVGLIAYAVFQALPGQRSNQKLRTIAPLFLLSSVANCAWLLLWHYNFITLSMVAMLLLLVTLIAIYTQLDIGGPKTSTSERWLVDAPFRVYLGWITVATIANATVVLYNLGWNGWGIDGPTWGALLVVVATVIGGAIVLKRGDWAYGSVLVWAFVGLFVKYSDTPILSLTAATMAGVVVLLMVVGSLRRRSPLRPVPQTA